MSQSNARGPVIATIPSLSSTTEMTLRIEKSSEGNTTTIRLIGRVQAEHLDELNAQIKNSELPVALDLSEVSLVDIDVVRFLGACQSKGIKLTGCSPYIREWIARELEREHGFSRSLNL